MGGFRVLAILVATVRAGVVLADSGDLPPIAPSARTPKLARVVGIGTYGGGGYVAPFVHLRDCSAFDCNAASPAGVEYSLPTLVLQAFPFEHRDYSVDVNTALSDTFMWSAASVFFWRADAFVSFNTGSGVPRLIAGPGLGFFVYSTKGRTDAWAFRVPGELGLELLTNNQAFGFKLIAEPLFEIVGGPASGISAGPGAVFMLGMSGYVRRRATDTDTAANYPR